MSKDTLMKNAEAASRALAAWPQCSNYPSGVPYFHLRPTSGGVTLVSTYCEKAMRGITKIALSRCIEMLESAGSAVSDTSIDWCNIKYNKRTFPERSEKSLGYKKEKEYAIQAWLINEIVKGNSALCERFKVSKLLYVGSEIIWQEGTTRGGKKIDIVAHDGNGKVMFLELKNKDNTNDKPEKQVLGYLESYCADESFKRFLLAYPAIPQVKKIDSFEGWTVIGDCENLSTDKLDMTHVIL